MRALDLEKVYYNYQYHVHDQNMIKENCKRNYLVAHNNILKCAKRRASISTLAQGMPIDSRQMTRQLAFKELFAMTALFWN